MQPSDKRLIEDAIPVEVISRTSASEKVGGRIGHPANLHLWWARRPLAAARAAVYATLMPAAGRTRSPEEDAEFFDAMCRWGASDLAIKTARAEVLAAHGGVPPKVIDLFSGGGAIPLEAARLGCDVTAVELNPVAHLIERMMLEFPQRFPGLADDVRRWGKVWADAAEEQLADLYPPVDNTGQLEVDGSTGGGRRPIAYLWTRTVRCPNPAAPPHDVHLVRQTWLGKKKGRMVALRPRVDHDTFRVIYEVVQAPDEKSFGFDPGAGSKRGQVACRACGATVTADYVKAEGKGGRLGIAPLAAVVVRRDGRGREYLPVGSYELPDDEECLARLATLTVSPPDEELVHNYNQAIIVPMYGLSRFRDLFTVRQLLSLCTLSGGIQRVYEQACSEGLDPERAVAVAAALAVVVDKVADHNSVLVPWIAAASYEGAAHTYARQALPMVWDFAETNPFAGSTGDVRKYLKETADTLGVLEVGRPAICVRGSATSVPVPDGSQDAVITDPPYYDNISYADLSDFFYVWLKRSLGELLPADFGGELTPKRSEAVSVAHRHGDRGGARQHYETLMAGAFAEAHRVLKPGAPLVVVYAHKTTMGWASLVDALRAGAFVITEAWPLDTEMAERSRGQGSAALASSIFLVARRRDADAGVGYESDVLDQLDEIIAERLARLQTLGVTGADLVIATAGAGLRALTQYQRVEQDNGEPLPSERFLALVQGKVLDAIFGELAGAGPATRFYTAAAYSYGYAAVDFDEANNLARITGADLDSPRGLTGGTNPLVAKTKSTVALRDYEARGGHPRCGQRDEDGSPSPLIDVAHGVLWRAEHHPADLRGYLVDARPDVDALRRVVQALAGKALRTGRDDAKGREAAAAERLLVSWRRLVEENVLW